MDRQTHKQTTLIVAEFDWPPNDDDDDDVERARAYRAREIGHSIWRACAGSV